MLLTNNFRASIIKGNSGQILEDVMATIVTTYKNQLEKKQKDLNTLSIIGKFYIFSAAISKGYIWLAVIGVINSLISIYYYLRIVPHLLWRKCFSILFSL